jgi:hypothetical protein
MNRIVNTSGSNTKRPKNHKAVILMVTQNPEFTEKSENTESITKLAKQYRIGRKTHMT